MHGMAEGLPVNWARVASSSAGVIFCGLACSVRGLHRTRGVMDSGKTIVMGAAVACFFAGAIATPLAHKFKLPFAALAFASVVAMMPGVFLFKISDALYAIYEQGERGGTQLLVTVAADLMTATFICLAIALGQIVPKLTIDRYCYKEA